MYKLGAFNDKSQAWYEMQSYTEISVDLEKPSLTRQILCSSSPAAVTDDDGQTEGKNQ